MSAVWSGRDINEAMRLFVKFDLEYCSKVMGRSKSAIKKLAVKRGVKTNRPKTPRSIYAEDIANIMEFKSMGFSNKDISKCLNVSPNTIKHHLSDAAKHGIDKYPKRELAC